MARAQLLLYALLLIFVDEVNSSTSEDMSELTAIFCGTIPREHDITVEIVAQNDQTRKGTIPKKEKTAKQDVVKINLYSFGQKTSFKYQFNQTALKKVKLSSTARHICIKALVVDTTIVVDQPTDFKTTCPEETKDDVPDRPCKRLGNPIDMSKLFICPQRLKDLLHTENLIESNPRAKPKRGEPPIYDITGDMAQASLTIATGIAEYGDTITVSRRNYKDARKSVSYPLRKMLDIASHFKTAASFISNFVPVFTVFSGVASIATTFLTPNPFDEIAKYLDEQFKQVNDQLFNIQTDIADLGRLIEAKSGVLGMTKQIRTLRHSARNYGVMVTAMSTRPVCGAKESFQMKEVAEFMRQYEADGVDNCLLDLYGVEFGELAEATSLLRPYMMAYCHKKPHLVKKFADELIYFGYAGLQSHFAYYSLIAAFKGGDFTVDDAWLTKLYKFVRKASVFKEASKKIATDSSMTNSLQFDLEDEILMKVKQAENSQTENTVIGWLEKIILNENDWPRKCLMKKGDGKDRKESLLMLYFKVPVTVDGGNTDPANVLRVFFGSGLAYFALQYDIPSTHRHLRLWKVDPTAWGNTQACSRNTNLIMVFYCPDPGRCGQQSVVVSWSKVCLELFASDTDDFGISKGKVTIPKKWMETAKRFPPD